MQIACSVYDLWSGQRRSAKQAFTIACKMVPLVLAGITIGLLQTQLVQRSFVVYMVVANVQCKYIEISYLGLLDFRVSRLISMYANLI